MHPTAEFMLDDSELLQPPSGPAAERLTALSNKNPTLGAALVNAGLSSVAIDYVLQKQKIEKLPLETS